MIWLIGIGGSLGAAARYIVSNQVKSKYERVYPFPLGTLLINIVGSFILGLLANLYIGSWIWYFWGMGFCGAFTTFSTFGYELVTLIELKKIRLALIYVSFSVVFGLLAAFIGYRL
jgi:CrcB protein